jgi:hypothetical protein
MAPNFSKYAAPPSDTSYYTAAAPIHLQHPRHVEWDSGIYLNLQLLAVPGNNDSQMYSIPVRYFDNGTPEEWLMFQNSLSKILIGQNITTGPPGDPEKCNHSLQQEWQYVGSFSEVEFGDEQEADNGFQTLLGLLVKEVGVKHD